MDEESSFVDFYGRGKVVRNKNRDDDLYDHLVDGGEGSDDFVSALMAPLSTPSPRSAPE